MTLRLGGLPRRSVELSAHPAAPTPLPSLPPPAGFPVTMHLLYLDDAGSVGNASEQYLVLGGVSLFEAQSHWITQELDTLAESFNPGDPHGVEFHASEIYARGSQAWKGLTQQEARGTIKSVLDVLARAYDTARASRCEQSSSGNSTSSLASLVRGPIRSHSLPAVGIPG